MPHPMLHAATILPTDASPDSQPDAVGLVYPRSWSVDLGPFAHEATRRAESWLRARGVIADEAGAEKFRRLAVAQYANWPFPHATLERAEIITKFLALWIFYDDAIEEHDDGQQAQIFHAIAGDLDVCPPGNAHLRCWWELGRSYARTMSPAWLLRHARRFAAWVDSVRDESRGAERFRGAGVLPGSAEHLARRRLNIGMIPNIDFLEYQMGWELPSAMIHDPDMLALMDLSAEVVALVNDLYGYTKDRTLAWCNMVPCVAHERRVPLDEAFGRVAAMHNARVRAAAPLEERLLAKCEDRPRMAQWIQGLRHIMYGFARWHAIAPRYRAHHELGEARRVELRIVHARAQ